MQHNAKQQWEEYCTTELSRITPILHTHGFTLEMTQPHLLGERYLMNAVTTTSGKKLILLGRDTAQNRVVIKVSNTENGIREINHERECRDILERIDFARDIFHTPEDVAYIVEGGYVVSVQKYIAQTCSFLERPIAEQFAFALAAFKGQEGAHATTYKHRALIESTFGLRTARSYLETFASFKDNVTNVFGHDADVSETLSKAYETLKDEQQTIEQYCGFLTHTDFVPHNFRITGTTMYLLDHSSLTFGNKYEGWARFINFMALYNPPLQKALEQYIRDNRTHEEADALRLMRIYRLGEIIWYYVRTLEKSADTLHTLNTERIHFWKQVLQCVLQHTDVHEAVRNSYTTKRDALRSSDEKQRQVDLH